MADEAYFQHPPKKQFFYKALAFALSFVALFWYEWWDMKFPRLLHYLLSIMYYMTLFWARACVSLQMLYMYTRWSEISFSTHSNIFTIAPTAALILVKVQAAQFTPYINLMKSFLDEIHLYNFRSNPYMKQRAIEAEKHSRYLVYFFIVFLFMDWTLWTVVPIVFNIENSEAIENKQIALKTCFYMWLPFDYEYDFNNWVMVHIMNSGLIALGCFIVACYDTINYSIVLHLIGHIRSLKHMIKTNVNSHMSDDDTKQKIFGEIERAFGINVTGNYLYNLIADSLLLYHLMLGDKENKLMYGFMMLVFLGGLMVMTLVLEEVRRQTIDIPECVYDMPWENMSIPNKKIVLVMLARTQPTLEYKGAGGLRAGVNPTIQIIKSTFSYYVMLKSSL